MNNISHMLQCLYGRSKVSVAHHTSQSVDTRATMPPLTQNTLRPTAFRSPSLFMGEGAGGWGFATRNVNRHPRDNAAAHAKYLAPRCVVTPPPSLWGRGPGGGGLPLAT